MTSPAAKGTLVWFSDYNCRFCDMFRNRLAAGELDGWDIRENPDDVKVDLTAFPTFRREDGDELIGLPSAKELRDWLAGEGK